MVTGPWTLAGGAIRGGRVETTGGAALVGSASGGLLDGVTLAGTLDLTGGFGFGARVTNGLTLDGGTVLLGHADADYSFARLRFDGSQTLGGDGEVVQGGLEAARRPEADPRRWRLCPLARRLDRRLRLRPAP